MNKKLREQVYHKFGGRCAYTGKPLGDDWQVDHITSRFEHNYFMREEDVDIIDNLFPTLKIVNHYKRSRNLGEFREYMEEFHIRFARYPKNPKAESSIKRKAYMQSIADAFGITNDKPFNGQFYFETI